MTPYPQPAQSVKAVEWEGEAEITFDPVRGLVIKIQGSGRVTTDFDQVMVMNPAIRDLNLPVDEDMTFDRPSGVEVGSDDLIAALRARAKAFLDTYKIRYQVETQGDKITFHFPEMDTIDPEVLDGLRGIFGTVDFAYHCGGSDAPKEEPGGDRRELPGTPGPEHDGGP
jgi:hypothetical protein